VIKRGPRPVRHDPGASRDGGGMDARTVALAALAGLLLVSGLFVLLARRFRPATLGLAGTFLATAGVLVLEGAPLAAIPVALSAVPALLSLRRLRGSGPRGLRVRVAGVLVAGVFLAALLLALAGVSWPVRAPVASAPVGRLEVLLGVEGRLLGALLVGLALTGVGAWRLTRRNVR
jgi:NADH:ubiquinone oxidoreductase subunit 6 (subunit J)